jgi:hypothetical protein
MQHIFCFLVTEFLGYLHVNFGLEIILFDDYLYDKDGSYTEADYIIKLFGPILENVFRESGCRLVW